VHLVVLGVQQDRSTVSAYIVNCVRASDENGRCMYYIFDAPGFYHSQCSLWIFHDRISSSVRAHIRVYAPHQRKLSEALFRWQCFYSMRRLLGPLPYFMDLCTRYRGGAAVLQFVRCERGDGPLLIGSDLMRECTGVKMKADNVHFLVDGVRAVVRNRFYNKAVFLGIRLAPAIGRDL
jgi:hypothetical protein